MSDNQPITAMNGIGQTNTGCFWLAAIAGVALVVVFGGGKADQYATQDTNVYIKGYCDTMAAIVTEATPQVCGPNGYLDVTVTPAAPAATPVPQAAQAASIPVANPGVIVGSDGARLCEDPQTHIYTTTACEGGQ